ncbi:MAG: GNAT family N-acetyltransferase [Methanosarcinales archaeon]
MKIIKKIGRTSYAFLENPKEVDYLEFEGLDFFHKTIGMVAVPISFKGWLSESTKPILLIAKIKNRVIGWLFMERWEENNALDGSPVWVLRAIEVHPDYRGLNIGRRLVGYATNTISGYVITKPITEDSKKFFIKLGFVPSDNNSPINLTGFIGYLILYPRERILLKDKVRKIDQNILEK